VETMGDRLNPPMESDTHDPSTVAMSLTGLEFPLFHSEESPDVTLIYKAAEKGVARGPKVMRRKEVNLVDVNQRCAMRSVASTNGAKPLRQGVWGPLKAPRSQCIFDAQKPILG